MKIHTYLTTGIRTFLILNNRFPETPGNPPDDSTVINLILNTSRIKTISAISETNIGNVIPNCTSNALDNAQLINSNRFGKMCISPRPVVGRTRPDQCPRGFRGRRAPGPSHVSGSIISRPSTVRWCVPCPASPRAGGPKTFGGCAFPVSGRARFRFFSFQCVKISRIFARFRSAVSCRRVCVDRFRENGSAMVAFFFEFSIEPVVNGKWDFFFVV